MTDEAQFPVQGPRSSDVLTHLPGHIPVRWFEHVAILHHGSTAADFGAEFVAEGLAQGHWCCYCAPADSGPAIISQLRELGVDVDRHLEARTLQLPTGVADAKEMLDRERRFFADAEAAHAAAIRWVEAGVWGNSSSVSAPQFFALHARLNYLVKMYPGAALCEYHVDQMEVPHIFSAIAVHRHLLVEGTLVRDNPFYIPAEKYLAMNPEDRERDLRDLFREVGFDLEKLLSTIAGFGHLQCPAPPIP